MANKYFRHFLKTQRVPKVIPAGKMIIYADRYLKFLSRHYDHFMFNDGRIIYNHCLKTKKFCYLIAKKYNADKQLLGAAAFLHESGKAFKTSWRILRNKYNRYNWIIAKDLIDRFDIPVAKKQKLKQIILHQKKNELIENKILHEADIIAFFADRRSQKALNKWARENGVRNELKRKFRKIKKLKLKPSRKNALPYWRHSLKFWRIKPEGLERRI
jgi:HD superfamily phosphodiesterase